MTKIVAVCNYKGGSGKTTSCMYLAHAFRDKGQKVLLVDLDPQQSLTKWKYRAELDLPLEDLSSAKDPEDSIRDLPLRRYDMVVIDTPPADGPNYAVLNSMSLADFVVIPTAASGVEVEQISAVTKKLKMVGGRPYSVLLNRDVGGSSLGREAREVLADMGHDVLTPSIPHRVEVQRTYFRGLTHRLFGYDLLADRIMERIDHGK